MIILWGTRSNAFDKSKEIMSKGIELFVHSAMYLSVTSKLVTVDLPTLNPCCILHNKLLSSM